MNATDLIELEMATLLSTDTTTLDAVGRCKVHLAQNPFTPGPGLTLGGLIEATFTGYGAIAIGAGAWLVYRDPNSGAIWIEAPTPAGGWHFSCTGGTGLPQTIYGFYVTDSTDATLYGAELLAVPIVVSFSGVGFDVGPVRFPLPRGSIGP